MELYHFWALNASYISFQHHSRIEIALQIPEFTMTGVSIPSSVFSFSSLHCDILKPQNEIACEPKLPPKSYARNTLKMKYTFYARATAIK